MKKDIRAYTYEQLASRDGTDRGKEISVQSRFMNGCM